MPTTRKLAAIMFTDIVGYTTLMGKDEDHAFEVLRKNREIHTTFIDKYNGTLIKEMGDGMLTQFNSATDAVQCAIDIQEKVREALEGQIRIGIHLGILHLKMRMFLVMGLILLPVYRPLLIRAEFIFLSQSTKQFGVKSIFNLNT